MKRCVLVLVALGCLPAATFAQEVEPVRLPGSRESGRWPPFRRRRRHGTPPTSRSAPPAIISTSRHWRMRVARDHGVPLDEAVARADATKAFNFSDIDRAVQYTYVIEPAVDDAYRMVAAHAAGVKPNLGDGRVRASADLAPEPAR